MELTKGGQLGITHTGEVVSGEFERYRQAIDEASMGARKTGLFEEGLYYEALDDERTISLDEEGTRFPVFTPLKYVAGYDLDRCVDLTGAENIEALHYLSLTPAQIEGREEELAKIIQGSTKAGDKIFFDHAVDDVEAARIYEQLMLVLSDGSGEVIFGNPDPEDEKVRASLSLFTADVTRTPEAGVPEGSTTDIRGVFEKSVASGDAEKWPENGVTLLSSEDVDDALFDKLWTLYQDRFQWLGQDHPISMEDTADEFRDILNRTNPLIPVTYKDGEPVCFAYFFDGTDACTWLREGFMESIEDPNKDNLFFGGIVANADGIGGYAEDLISMITDLASQTGQRYKVLFESTNVSETYIPSMVQSYIDGTKNMSSTDPIKVSEHLYRAMEVKG